MNSASPPQLNYTQIKHAGELFSLEEMMKTHRRLAVTANLVKSRPLPTPMAWSLLDILAAFCIQEFFMCPSVNGPGLREESSLGPVTKYCFTPPLRAASVEFLLKNSSGMLTELKSGS